MFALRAHTNDPITIGPENVPAVWECLRSTLATKCNRQTVNSLRSTRNIKKKKKTVTVFKSIPSFNIYKYVHSNDDINDDPEQYLSGVRVDRNIVQQFEPSIIIINIITIIIRSSNSIMRVHRRSIIMQKLYYPEGIEIPNDVPNDVVV